MWYLSGQGWEGERSAYDVKYAESEDGVHWRRDGRVALSGERNIARACVLPGYEAWFSADAGDGYRIRSARSGDGLTWERTDDGLEERAPTRS